MSNSLDDRISEETKAGLIVTFTGKTIRPLDPDPNDVDIEDIAHALANSCRFTGHVSSFYSVAQHSYLCSLLVPEEFRLTGLLHDASEAYLSDIARPIKSQSDFGDVYKKYEGRLEEVIAERFGLVYPYPPEVREADSILLITEQRDLMPDVLRHGGDGMGDIIQPLLPEEAETQFLLRYYQLT